MTMKRKRKSRAGFTLAETLLAVTILLLVSSIVVAGIPAAKNAYEKVVLASDAEMMLSTAASTLRDELGTAWGVKVVNGVVTYYSADTGMRSELSLSGSDLQITEYGTANANDQVLSLLNKANPADAKTSRKLVYQSSQDRVQLHVQASFSLDSWNKILTVSDLQVVKDDGTPLAEWKDQNENTEFEIPVFSVE